jgi:hypothetical protein
MVRVPVRLHSADPEYNVFLAEHEVEVAGAHVRPVTYEGRLFVFLRKTLIGSYQHAAQHEAYVFTDAGALGDTT